MTFSAFQRHVSALTFGFACVIGHSVLAQSNEETALVKGIFAELNPISIRDKVEYCGYIGITADGDLIASPPTRGDEASCLADDPTEIEVIYSSYHTHGQFSRDYFNEVPSGTDMEGDEEEGIDGWIATPGGRLWYNDTVDMVTFQVCGIGCVPSDPNFVAGDMGTIEQSYSYDDLVILLED